MKYCCQGQSDGGVLLGARGFPGPLPSSDADCVISKGFCSPLKSSRIFSAACED